MARQARKISPTGYYHVMLRGNNREDIFSGDRQKAFFTELLMKLERAEVAAYCLMNNHVHIIIQGEAADMSDAMKKINIRYAARFNSETGRIGHVFCDRYKSEIISNESYLLQAVRYVHNNPVKAGLVKTPDEYSRSSFCEYAKDAAGITSQSQRKFILDFFNGDREAFRQFHQKEDHAEFLDVAEEVDHNRLQRAQAIIEEFRSAAGKSEEQGKLRSPFYSDELIVALLKGSGLSHRKIAQLLGINSGVVHKISTKIRLMVEAGNSKKNRPRCYTNTPAIETKRLILRRFGEDDIEALFAIHRDEDVNTYLPWFTLKSLEEAKAFFETRYLEAYEQPCGYRYAICLKSDNIPIGYVNVSMEDSHDLGYGLRKEFWHKGIVTEACTALVEQVKKDGLPYITATHDVKNPRSGGVMKQIGMSYKYSYEEQWQPKDFLVTYRMYQLNFDGQNDRIYNKYWDNSTVHFIETGV